MDDYVYRFYPEAEISSVGKGDGLWGVTKAPASGWEESMASVLGNGYVVRLKYHTAYKYVEGVDGSTQDVNPGDPDYVEGIVYARLFIEDELSSGGSQSGVKIKIQYPFNPR